MKRVIIFCGRIVAATALFLGLNAVGQWKPPDPLFKSVIQETRAKTSIPILLPYELSPDIGGPKVRPRVVRASTTEYFISLDYYQTANQSWPDLVPTHGT